jgi:uncharacterized protein
MNRTLIIFARKPELGKVKTRLAKETSDIKALEVYNQLLDQTIEVSNNVNATVKIYWSDKTTWGSYRQKGKDIGERMYNALSKEVKKSRACLIGTDSPLITSSIINNAFDALDSNDIVFGPSYDGGYYLIASKSQISTKLFINKKWSHKEVLKDALAVCKQLKLKVKLMPSLLDIDTIDDYHTWKNIIT